MSAFAAAAAAGSEDAMFVDATVAGGDAAGGQGSSSDASVTQTHLKKLQQIELKVIDLLEQVSEFCEELGDASSSRKLRNYADEFLSNTEDIESGVAMLINNITLYYPIRVDNYELREKDTLLREALALQAELIEVKRASIFGGSGT